MPHFHPITVSPSIAVVQRAYDWFCAPTYKAETICYSGLGGDAVGDQRNLVVTDPLADEWLTFQRLAKQWRSQRGATSSITEAALCPAYQSIIGMGESVVPFILWQLRSEGEEPDQWFWALMAITKATPVRDEDRGDFVKMSQAWLEWGTREGYGW